MRVTVTLKDSKSGEAVPFAYVATKQGDAYKTAGQADGDGVVSFDYPTGNTVNLKVSTVGYEDRYTSFPADGSPRVVDLFEKVSELKPVVVEREKKKGVPGWAIGLGLLVLIIALSDD